ncbi:hypothetical protein RKD23_004245 [Streptomyces sp. SAI-170]|uniref:CHAT domain-containing protein n=1 Tax=Streptomyces sp. SAI-170 TaxID=3377729 RepID=UPI003C7BC11B
MRELRLHVRDFAGPDRWSWELTGPDVRARHDVRLDVSRPEYEAFLDLAGFVRRHAPPDRRVAREREIVREVGAWIGAEVLGPIGPLLLAAAPAVVRVVVPADVPAARRLLFVPLELAHVRGRPLAVQDVTPVMQVGQETTTAEERSGRPVRVLALFSLPQGSRALNLRRERTALTGLFAEAARSGRAVELRALQYGVSRERLRAVLAEPGGWDIVHVSGHGTAGELLLETDTGRPDRVTAADLAGLLATARRVGLVTLSACWSAALTVREQRRALGIPTASGEAAESHSGGAPDVGGVAGEPAEGDSGRAPDAGGVAGEPAEGDSGRAPDVGVVAGELVARLGCAVLAMRYPVADEFAVALAEGLYRRLVVDGLPLPRALAGALSETAPQHGPALSAATPALFGARAAALRLTPPRHPAGPPAAPHTSGVPPLPDRFVGRVPLMARLSALLAPGSGACGAVLQGMPGAGKTACARELVETHAHAFETVVWFKVPERRESDAGGVLAEFAAGVAGLLEASPGQAGRPLGDGEEFAAALASCLARRRVLLVLDHVDALLGPDGRWRDPRWAQLVEALSGPAGPGRTLLTCRVRPPGAGPPAAHRPGRPAHPRRGAAAGP